MKSIQITMRVISFLIILSLFISCKSKTSDKAIDLPLFEENTSALRDSSLAPFYHGVASGDPYAASVVLWTRVTPLYQVDSLEVQWEISTDAEFQSLSNQGKVMTNAARDYTVKIVADKLQANRRYFYRFKHGDKYSMVGQTKTLPTEEEPANLAFVSCSNVEFGYFNAYAALAKEDVDVVVHLGDYIYEYGPDVYGDTSFYRKNIPPHEIISLQDYRDRYSQYRLDEDLRAVHARHPFINIWDDHEFMNNAYVGGAENHQSDEGDYDTRKNTAKQVYYEWLPIREGEHHYRKFSFGSQLELLMLDERIAGRTQQADSLADPRRESADQTLLGDEQMQWLQNSLVNSKANWNIIGNQVIFSYCDWGYDGFGLNMDDWNGYPGDQLSLASTIQGNAIQNVVFVTGDTHTSWAFESSINPLEDYNQETGAGTIAVEFGVTSISSGNSNERRTDDEVLAHEKKICNTSVNPHLKYVNMRDHGYLILHVNAEELNAEYKVVSTLKSKNFETTVDQRILVMSGTHKLILE